MQAFKGDPNAKPGATANPMMDFLVSTFKNIDINKIIEGITGGAGSNPAQDFDKETFNQVLIETRERAKADKEAAVALRNKLREGYQAFTNENGDVIFTKNVNQQKVTKA